MTDVELDWLDENTRPQRGGSTNSYNWPGIAAGLRQRPGKWARVARNIPRSHASAITSGLKKDFRPPEHYEVETHADPDIPGQRANNRADLYMRYVGGVGRSEDKW